MKVVDSDVSVIESSAGDGKFELHAIRNMLQLASDDTLENAKTLVEFGERMRVGLRRYIESNDRKNAETFLHFFAELEQDLNARVPQSAFALNKDNLEKIILLNHYFLEAIEPLFELGLFNKAFSCFASITMLANRMIFFHNHNPENSEIVRRYTELKGVICAKFADFEKKFFNALAASYLSSKNEAIPDYVNIAINSFQKVFFENVANLGEGSKSKVLIELIQSYIKTKELPSLFLLTNVLGGSEVKDSGAITLFVNQLIAIGYNVAEIKRDLGTNNRNLQDAFNFKELNQLEMQAGFDKITQEFDSLVEWIEFQKFHEVDIDTAKLKLKASSDALSAVGNFYNKVLKDMSDKAVVHSKIKLLNQFTGHLKGKNKDLVSRVLNVINVEPNNDSAKKIELLHAIIVKQIPLLFSAHDHCTIIEIIKFSAEYIKISTPSPQINNLKQDLINMIKNFNDAMYIYFGKIVLASITPGKTTHDYRNIVYKFAGKEVVSNLVDTNIQSLIYSMLVSMQTYKNKFTTLQKFKTLVLNLDTGKNLGLDINVVCDMLKEMQQFIRSLKSEDASYNLQLYIADIEASIKILGELTYKPLDLSKMIEDEEREKEKQLSKQKNKSVVSSSSSSGLQSSNKSVVSSSSQSSNKSVATSSSASSSQLSQKPVEKQHELSKEDELLTHGDWQVVGEKKKKVVEEVAPVVQQNNKKATTKKQPVAVVQSAKSKKDECNNASAASVKEISTVAKPQVVQANVTLADLQEVVTAEVKVVVSEPSQATAVEVAKEEVGNNDNNNNSHEVEKPKPFEFNKDAPEFIPCAYAQEEVAPVYNDNNMRFPVQPVMVACTSFVPLGPIQGTPFVYGVSQTEYVPMIPLMPQPPDVVHNQQSYYNAMGNNYGRNRGGYHRGGSSYYRK